MRDTPNEKTKGKQRIKKKENGFLLTSGERRREEKQLLINIRGGEDFEYGKKKKDCNKNNCSCISCGLDFLVNR